MVEIEVEATHAYQIVLRELGRPSPRIDPKLEHILITGMFHTFFELIIHEMPVSYTHLDVYKRQAHCLERYNLLIDSAVLWRDHLI